MALGGIAGIAQRAVDIGRALLKAGEHKAHLGRAHHPVRLAGMEQVIRRAIAQRSLGQLDRAHSANNVLEHLVAHLIIALTVMIAEGHVVSIVRQQDQKAALLRQSRQHALEKHLSHIVIRDGRIAQRGQ